MKKLLLLSAIIFGAFYSASAQYYYSKNDNTPTVKLGFGISSGFTTGPVSNAFPEAGAITANLELPLGKSPVSVLFQTGYTFYVSGGSYDVGFGYYGYGGGADYYGNIASFIPVEAGLKVYVAPRVFIEGLAGVSFNVNSYSSEYTGNANAFVYQPGLGYSFPFGYRGKSNLDLSLMYENRPETGGGYSQVGLKAVWNFNLGR
jgi:hypothetical protein